MNGFRKMQEALGKEGWFVAWNLPCCQTCAWSELSWLPEPPKDMSKVLFNHSQDCEVQSIEEECGECDGDEDCAHCHGTGYVDFGDVDPEEYDTSVGGFVCNYPEQQDGSTFCFDGSPEGVENLTAVLPIIEAAGCKVNWNGSGGNRPYISW